MALTLKVVQICPEMQVNGCKLFMMSITKCPLSQKVTLILNMIFLQLAILDELERIEIALAKNREKQVITLENVCSPYTVR